MNDTGGKYLNMLSIILLLTTNTICAPIPPNERNYTTIYDPTPPVELKIGAEWVYICNWGPDGWEYQECTLVDISYNEKTNEVEYWVHRYNRNNGNRAIWAYCKETVEHEINVHNIKLEEENRQKKKWSFRRK